MSLWTFSASKSFSTRVGVFCFLALGLVLVLAEPVGAQMLPAYLSLGGRPWDPSCTCENAPVACTGGTLFAEYGTYEFSMSRVFLYGEPVDRVPVTFHWPAGWTLLGYEVCYGVLESGDPAVRNTPVVFSFADCLFEERPFFRAWFDCPSPGTFSATPAMLNACGGYPVLELMGLYASVGDQCGLHAHGHCSLCGYHGESASFHPGSYEVTLPPATLHEVILAVSGNTGPYCGGLPECGCGGYGADFAGLRTDRDWMTVEMLDYEGMVGFREFHYRLRIPTFLLPPGDHEGRISAYGSCCANEACIPVVVHVLSPTDAPVIQPSASLTPTLSLPIPNPTRGSISYSVQVPEEMLVRVLVFNAGGQFVGTALNEQLPAGLSWKTWTPSEELLARISSGAYFLRMETVLGGDSRMFVIRR